MHVQPRERADELHALLEQAAIPGPYALVGHSIGGMTMQLFASAHPDEVAGIVLVEAADDPSRLWALMPESDVAHRRAELASSHMMPRDASSLIEAAVYIEAAVHDAVRGVRDHGHVNRAS